MSWISAPHVGRAGRYYNMTTLIHGISYPPHVGRAGRYYNMTTLIHGIPYPPHVGRAGRYYNTSTSHMWRIRDVVD
jgi:hypothetical protein